MQLLVPPKPPRRGRLVRRLLQVSLMGPLVMSGLTLAVLSAQPGVRRAAMSLPCQPGQSASITVLLVGVHRPTRALWSLASPYASAETTPLTVPSTGFGLLSARLAGMPGVAIRAVALDTGGVVVPLASGCA